MEITDNTLRDTAIYTGEQGDGANSAVSWAAIIAGAFTAAAVMLILLLLGSGLGLAAVSPWANSGISMTTFTVTTAVWLIASQWIASGLSGYLTGRLRTKWMSVDTDEIFFRDTAHGFLAWALATVITAGFLASAVAAIIGGGASAVTAVTAGAAAGAGLAATQNSSDAPASITTYIVDTLYRTNPMNPSGRMSPATEVPANTALPPGSSEAPVVFETPAAPLSTRTSIATKSKNDAHAETLAILINGVRNGSVPEADRVYLAQLVVQNTELSMEEARKRVDETIAQIEAAEVKLRQAADTARKTASTVSVYSFLSLLIGAFIASAAAALGGQHRDEY